MSEPKRATKHDETAKERQEVFKTIYGLTTLGSFDLKSGKVSENSILEQFKDRYNEVKNESVEKVQSLYRDYSYAIFFMYSPSAIRNNLVKFKNIIKKEGGKYKANALEAFTIDNIYAPVKAKDRETKRELKEELRAGESDSQTIDPLVIEKKVRELKEILEKKKYIVKKNQKEEQVRAYYIVALLGLATGRRFTEIMKTLTVRKRGTKLTFSGLLKGNDRTIDGNLIALSYHDVKKYLTELREFAKTENLTENEVNAKYARVFNNAIKRMTLEEMREYILKKYPSKKKEINELYRKQEIFYKKYGEEYRREANKITPMNVKALRHNYSVAGSQLFKRDGETIEDTITRILGHKEVFTSALNYV